MPTITVLPWCRFRLEIVGWIGSVYFFTFTDCLRWFIFSMPRSYPLLTSCYARKNNNKLIKWFVHRSKNAGPSSGPMSGFCIWKPQVCSVYEPVLSSSTRNYSIISSINLSSLSDNFVLFTRTNFQQLLTRFCFDSQDHLRVKKLFWFFAVISNAFKMNV